MLLLHQQTTFRIWYFAGGGAAYFGGGEGSVPTVVSIGVLPTAALKQLIGIYSLIPTTLSLYT